LARPLAYILMVSCCLLVLFRHLHLNTCAVIWTAFGGNPGRFIGSSSKCRALLHALHRLHGNGDLAGWLAVSQIILHLQKGLALW
jgi:hypothetical protein